MPLYRVQPNPERMPKDAKPRMISAPNQAQALRFACKDCYSIDTLDAEAAAELGAAGVKVERAEVSE